MWYLWYAIALGTQQSSTNSTNKKELTFDTSKSFPCDDSLLFVKKIRRNQAEHCVHKKEPSTIQKTILYENPYAMLYFIWQRFNNWLGTTWMIQELYVTHALTLTASSLAACWLFDQSFCPASKICCKLLSTLGSSTSVSNVEQSSSAFCNRPEKSSLAIWFEIMSLYHVLSHLHPITNLFTTRNT